MFLSLQRQKTINSTLESSYYISFRSSVQSHSLKVTLFISACDILFKPRPRNTSGQFYQSGEGGGKLQEGENKTNDKQVSVPLQRAHIKIQTVSLWIWHLWDLSSPSWRPRIFRLLQKVHCKNVLTLLHFVHIHICMYHIN